MNSVGAPMVRSPAVLVAAVAGLGVVVLSLIELIIMPASLAWMPEGFRTPVLALEFMVDVSTAKQMLGGEPLALQALISTLHWDMALLAAYGLFLAACAWALLDNGALKIVAMFFAVAAPLADYFENQQLLRILELVNKPLRVMVAADIDITYLRLMVVMKFGAIAIFHLRIIRALWGRNRTGRLLTSVILLNAFATGATFLNVSFAAEIMLNSILLCWLGLWIFMLLEIKSGWFQTRTE